MPEALYGISPALVERFRKIFAAFAGGVKMAVADAAQKPVTSESPGLRSWQEKALPLLEKDNLSIQAAAKAFEQGDAQPILTLAEDKRGLAKDLDGFSFTFAGPEHAENLELLETAVVTAACQISGAAGIP
ncbi:MAG: hypothetical protein WA419_03875 [Silvibacterium sp.]